MMLYNHTVTITEGLIMMKTIISLMGLIVFSFTALPAKTLKAHYDVTYGIVGKVGEARARLESSGNTYTIDIGMAATGLAATLSGNRKEHHRSVGHIENGLLVSDRYEVVRRYRDTRVVKTYTINHRKKKVLKSYKKYRGGKLLKDEHNVLDFYSKDDLLTLYFNLDRHLPDKHKAGTYHFTAVGAEKQKGRVTVILPTRAEEKVYASKLGSGAAWYANAIIHQKIFTSREGHLQLAVGRDGIAEKALLEDLILFGDITATRTE